MNTKPTPGPWKALDGAILSETLNHYGNFVVCDCRRELTPQDVANLRLIAAAPDLLEALEECESFLSVHRPDAVTTLSIARVAITKATGPF